MLPIRRDYRFSLPASAACTWHREGEPVSQFFNALSVFFPIGERFFISSLRHYRDQVKDPALKAEIAAFIGQEALHGREHQDYNAMLVNSGLPVKRLEKFVELLLGSIQKTTPAAWQLSVTIALEHFTATFADRLLRDRELLDGAEPEFRKLWLWHALEETEHKGVAYDVWKQAMGEGVDEFLVRSSGMVVTAAVFTALVGVFSVVMMESRAPQSKPASRLRRYRALGSFLMGEKGFFRNSSEPLLDYFRRDFRPWQHDNRELLGRLEELQNKESRPRQLPLAA